MSDVLLTTYAGMGVFTAGFFLWACWDGTVDVTPLELLIAVSVLLAGWPLLFVVGIAFTGADDDE